MGRREEQPRAFAYRHTLVNNGIDRSKAGFAQRIRTILFVLLVMFVTPARSNERKPAFRADGASFSPVLELGSGSAPGVLNPGDEASALSPQLAVTAQNVPVSELERTDSTFRRHQALAKKRARPSALSSFPLCLSVVVANCLEVH